MFAFLKSRNAFHLFPDTSQVWAKNPHLVSPVPSRLSYRCPLLSHVHNQAFNNHIYTFGLVKPPPPHQTNNICDVIVDSKYILFEIYAFILKSGSVVTHAVSLIWMTGRMTGSDAGQTPLTGTWLEGRGKGFWLWFHRLETDAGHEKTAGDTCLKTEK